MNIKPLPLPPHYDPKKVANVWRVPYQERSNQARSWALKHKIAPAAEDQFKVLLVLIDVQNTFCLPEFELYVGGRSGTGAIDDNNRLCQFIYKYLGAITQIVMTMDTHAALQIFHPQFLIDQDGQHPQPLTQITLEDVESGRWMFNPAIAPSLGVSAEYGQRQLMHYTKVLKRSGKYNLTVWPYHAMLGGIGHALVSSVEEAVFFHTIARYSQPRFEIKGRNPFTEHYSAFGPEVLNDADGKPLGMKNEGLFDFMLGFDAIIFAGQAKSHCVAASVEDFLGSIRNKDEKLAEKVYLLEDCTSPVVIPDVVDYSDLADAAFNRFADAGMHIVRSTDNMESWLNA
ncbi:MAG: hypothetical protein J7L73_00995 [Anaerolineales bacterium]|nr:hypothetical protein [Anaerolineales bacterium]